LLSLPGTFGINDLVWSFRTSLGNAVVLIS